MCSNFEEKKNIAWKSQVSVPYYVDVGAVFTLSTRFAERVNLRFDFTLSGIVLRGSRHPTICTKGNEVLMDW